MQRYLVFQWEEYFSNGGWGDFKCDFGDLESAKKSINRNLCWQIVDTHTKEEIDEG